MRPAFRTHGSLGFGLDVDRPAQILERPASLLEKSDIEFHIGQVMPGRLAASDIPGYEPNCQRAEHPAGHPLSFRPSRYQVDTKGLGAHENELAVLWGE